MKVGSAQPGVVESSTLSKSQPNSADVHIGTDCKAGEVRGSKMKHPKGSVAQPEAGSRHKKHSNSSPVTSLSPKGPKTAGQKKKSQKHPKQNVESDAKVYAHHMNLEILRKVKMFETAVENAAELRKTMVQARPCLGSEKIVQKQQRNGSVHEKLYKAAKKTPKNLSKDEGLPDANSQFDDCTFQPKINKQKKPAGEKGVGGKVEDRLTAIAKKRKEVRRIRKEEYLQSVKSAAHPKNAAKSQDYAYQRFMKEYEEALNKLGKEKGELFSYQDL